jgi:hypothetical protein
MHITFFEFYTLKKQFAEYQCEFLIYFINHLFQIQMINIFHLKRNLNKKFFDLKIRVF